jgi:hypothetical protein
VGPISDRRRGEVDSIGLPARQTPHGRAEVSGTPSYNPEVIQHLLQSVKLLSEYNTRQQHFRDCLNRPKNRQMLVFFASREGSRNPNWNHDQGIWSQPVIAFSLGRRNRTVFEM